VGALVFRLVAVGMASYMMQWTVVKLIGGLYLLYVAVKHFLWESKPNDDDRRVTLGPAGHPILAETGAELSPFEADEITAVRAPAERAAAGQGFWSTVLVIELTDIAFAVDSILAAIALVGAPPIGHVGTHPKLWVVVVGGMIGLVLMRFAAVVFIALLERYPRFETTAYLLVLTIGAKLLSDWGFNSAEHPHRVDFHDPYNPAFWGFWAVMLASGAYGFVPPKDGKARA
jgi:YkoY family integral membrane protein